MNVRRYLQKVGALPKVSREDMLMSVLTIINDFFTPVTTVKPDSLPWVTNALPDLREYNRRSNLMLTCSSGDIKAAMPFLLGESAESLEELILELLNLRIYIHSMGKGLLNIPSTDEYFVDCFNEMLGLGASNRFIWKSQILDLYFSNTLSEAGKVLIGNILDTLTLGEQACFSVVASFMEYLPSEYKVIQDESYVLSPEPMEALSGGVVSNVKLLRESANTTHECTLHWAPWPSAKTGSADSGVVQICEGFSAMGRDNWIKKLSE